MNHATEQARINVKNVQTPVWMRAQQQRNTQKRNTTNKKTSVACAQKDYNRSLVSSNCYHFWWLPSSCPQTNAHTHTHLDHRWWYWTRSCAFATDTTPHEMLEARTRTPVEFGRKGSHRVGCCSRPPLPVFVNTWTDTAVKQESRRGKELLDTRRLFLVANN
jgi:hypothetical protein